MFASQGVLCQMARFLHTCLPAGMFTVRLLHIKTPNAGSRVSTAVDRDVSTVCTPLFVFAYNPIPKMAYNPIPKIAYNPTPNVAGCSSSSSSRAAHGYSSAGSTVARVTLVAYWYVYKRASGRPPVADSRDDQNVGSVVRAAKDGDQPQLDSR